MKGHGHQLTEEEAAARFEPPSWDERYSGDVQVWSGNPNPQLVAEVAGLAPGTALDVGCGFTHLATSQRRAMFLAQDLLPGLTDTFEVLVAEQRPRTVIRDGSNVEIHDSTLLARRTP